MRITRIKLHNFRNYTSAQIVPDSGVTVFCGDNAQGKTGILEAVYLCCVGRSHRTSRDRELIRWGEDMARVEVDAQRADGSHEVDITLAQTEKKRIRVAGAQIARSGELMGHINGVLFSPEDLGMVKDGPAERRRFIDMELSQMRPAYYYALQRYNRALRQRGKLLRDAQTRPALLATLDVWDEQLAAAGAEIILARRAFIGELGEATARIYAEISAEREALSTEYQTIGRAEIGEAALGTLLLDKLRASRESDVRHAVTSVGPHRDDLALKLNGKDVRIYGSQGQQRSCALSLKLSELDVMKKATGECPVLMLDDVMSELDPGRRRHLIGMLDGVQTLITCTDLDDLAGAHPGTIYRVTAGVAQVEG